MVQATGARGVEDHRFTNRKGLEIGGWRERLEFLNRGQRWVARRIAEALPRITPSGAKSALQEMHESHLANIALCEQLLD